LGKIVAACARASLIRRTITGSKVAQHFSISVGSSELAGRARPTKSPGRKTCFVGTIEGSKPFDEAEESRTPYRMVAS
jgi:hypothetical protein